MFEAVEQRGIMAARRIQKTFGRKPRSITVGELKELLDEYPDDTHLMVVGKSVDGSCNNSVINLSFDEWRNDSGKKIKILYFHHTMENCKYD